MPKIPFNFAKGAFHNVDPFELTDPGQGADQRNILVDDAGALVGRPALRSFASIGSFGIEGATFFGGKIFLVTRDRRMYSVTQAGAVTDVTGLALGGDERPVFASDGEYLAIAGGALPQRWSGSGNTELMPGSPEPSTHIVYLDGYWINFLLGDQEARIAGPTAPARLIWNSADFIQAEGLPDKIRSMAVLLRELYLFSADSTEIFQNVGDSSTPFVRTFFIDRGIGAPYSLIQADNTLWFLDDERKFVTLQGRTPVTISTPYDRVIRKFETVSDCWGTRIDIGGFYLLSWTFPTEERTFVFDYKQKLWMEFDGFRDASPDRWRAHSHVFVKDWNKHFIGDFRTGTLWELTFDSHADGDQPRRNLYRTGEYDHGTGDRKASNLYRLHLKRGIGDLGSEEPKILLRWRDDGKPWGEYREVGLGFQGDTRRTVELKKTGIYRKRQLEISMTDAAEFRLLKLEEDVDLLA